VTCYVDTVHAPQGAPLVCFETYAHMPQCEELTRFHEALLHALNRALAPSPPLASDYATAP
jgi:hypothetical protein